MTNKNNNRSTQSSFTSLWICVLVGIVFLSAYTLLCAFSDLDPSLVGLIFLSVYMVIALTVYLLNRNGLARQRLAKRETGTLSTVMTDMIQNINIPFIITDTEEKIIWYNKKFSVLAKTAKPLSGNSLREYCSVPLSEIYASTYEETFHIGEELEAESSLDSGSLVHINDRYYNARSYRINVMGRDYFMTIFADTTDYFAVKDKLERENTAVAYIVLDNLEELAQYVRVSYRAAANEVEGLLKEWATGLGGMLREYDRDKYIFIFSQENLNKCVEDKFDILESIRNIRLGDSSMPVTVSMGISASGATLAEKERNANSALEMALQRGGDQVALKTDANFEFFGGRTKGVQRRTKVRARVISTQLSSLIAKSSNVLIMGHSNPDFDSIGACVGIARLALFCGVEAKIIVNTSSESFRSCTEKLLGLEEYTNMFIDGTAGLDLIRSETLLVVVDANNFDILESPEVAANAFNIVVIDHHRKDADFSKKTGKASEPLLSYIDPSASSACELVTEILEQTLPQGTLYKDEANVMLAGIMVDTKNFTRTTGTRTFSAALYLRSEGGNSEIARTFFNEKFEAFVAEAKFGSNVTVYKDVMAITTSEGSGSASDRVAASKAADKLLTVKNVCASFALVNINDSIHISARSNGTINVQLILEKLHGGGHFDVAGAQLSGITMKDALIMLKDAIDDYLNNNS